MATFFEEVCSFNYWIGAVISSTFCMVLLLFKFKGMEKINSILVPLIIFGIAILGMQEYDPSALIINEGISITPGFTNNWIISSIIYTSYNSIILIPVLTNFKRYNLSNLKSYIIGILVTLFLFIMSITLYNICDIYYPAITVAEIPTLRLAEMNNSIIKYFYEIVIVAAILTTAFSTGYNFLVMQKGNHYNRDTVLICILAVIFSKFGFSTLINTLFPIFGYIGIVQIIWIFLSNKIKEKRKDKS